MTKQSKANLARPTRPGRRRLGGRGVGSIALAAAAAIALPAIALAQVRGTIVGPGESAFPLAVAPATGDDGCADRFSGTIARDLDLSGVFRVLGPQGLPAIADPAPDALDAAAWAQTGARLLVRAACSAADGGIAVEARLFDVAAGRVMGGKRYAGPRRELRRMGHRFADEVMRLVTGERGPFSARIAFVSTRGGRAKEIFEMGFDGEDVRQLTRNGTINLSPAWSPDGRGLLVTSFKDGAPRLYALDLSSGRSRTLLAGTGLVNGGRWSPDGATIAVSREESRGDSSIVVIAPDGRLVRRVGSDGGIDVSPTWSPDGSRLAFCSTRGGSPQIYVGDAGGGGARRVTFAGSYNTSPAWSPRGDRIAYTGRVGGRFQVFVVPASGGEPRQLTTSGGDNTDPAWSPDGRYILFSSTREGAPRLYLMDDLGLRQRPLLRSGAGDTAPAWSSWVD